MPADEVELALKQGNVAMLAPHFGPSVDITLNNVQSTYSAAQAEMVLRKFFLKNNVQNFEMQLTGKSGSTNTIYTIGTLTTAKGSFKVLLNFKPYDNKIVLQQIRIEK